MSISSKDERSESATYMVWTAPNTCLSSYLHSFVRVTSNQPNRLRYTQCGVRQMPSDFNKAAIFGDDRRGCFRMMLRACSSRPSALGCSVVGSTEHIQRRVFIHVSERH